MSGTRRTKGRAQHAAVDHLRKFVADELILDPKGVLRLGALGRIYFDWCELHGVVNRRLPSSLLLLRLEEDFGLKCGRVYAPVANRKDSEPVIVYAMQGARLRDPKLNGRQTMKARVPVARAWRPIIEGLAPDRATRIDAVSDDEMIGTDED